MSLSTIFSNFACGPWGTDGFSHGGFGHGGFFMGSGFGFGGFHFPFGLLTLLLLTGLAFWFISRHRTPVRQEHSSPLEILKRRYANGEINSEEYQRLRAGLDS
ncbi:MAG: SHOCT domain-containing protein [Desulfovibrio sp.]